MSSPLARERTGWVFYDWANQVFQTSVITVFLSLYLTGVAEADARASGQPCVGDSALQHCDVSLFGVGVAAGSVYGYLISLATVVQVLVLPIAGAIADRTQNKRRMLGAFAFLGATATAALALVAGTNWQLGSGCSCSPTPPTARRSSCTTPSCPSWRARTSGTRCRPAAGRSATSAAGWP